MSQSLVRKEWKNIEYLEAQIEALQKENQRLNALVNSKRLEDIEVNLN